MMRIPDILAARVISDTTFWEQVGTFLSFRHLSLVYGVAGAVLLGICCGLLGSFIVLRRMSLLGDSIGHAVLPGICLAFVITQEKNALAIFAGAIAAGVVATWVISAITRFSRIKSDTAIGLVLSGFFGLGIVLLTRIQRMSFGEQSGLDRYMFGDAAALSPEDLRLMGLVTVVVVLAITLFFRYFLVTSFDEHFAAALGMPVRLIQVALMTLLALAIVIALQAVGVVLVSAMLITPAATAYLLTDRLGRMLALSALFGVLSGFVGMFLSFVLNRIPTGPCMVLAASTWFALAYLFSPKQGVALRTMRQWRRRRRIEGENLLKTAYLLLEGKAPTQPLPIETFAEVRSESPAHVRRVAKALAGADMARLGDRELTLTPSGYERARQVVRNHRLWELYLANEASIAADHVHRDAEEIEHVLGEDIVARLEEMLEHPEHDPHGHPIPRTSGSGPPQAKEVADAR